MSNLFRSASLRAFARDLVILAIISARKNDHFIIKVCTAWKRVPLHKWHMPDMIYNIIVFVTCVLNARKLNGYIRKLLIAM